MATEVHDVRIAGAYGSWRTVGIAGTTIGAIVNADVADAGGGARSWITVTVIRAPAVRLAVRRVAEGCSVRKEKNRSAKEKSCG